MASRRAPLGLHQLWQLPLLLAALGLSGYDAARLLHAPAPVAAGPQPPLPSVACDRAPATRPSERAVCRPADGLPDDSNSTSSKAYWDQWLKRTTETAAQFGNL